MSDGGGNAAWLALVAVVPLVALMLTSFVKVSVVLSLLRNAIGATDAPSGLVVMGLSLVLTFFVMAPVAVDMVTAASATAPVPGAPGGAGQLGSATPSGASGANQPAGPQNVSAEAPASAGAATKPLELDAAVRALVPPQHHAKLDALERGLAPLRAFLEKHAGERDRATFVELAARMGRTANGDELWVLAPAFLTTELREAFAIAVLIFVPFLVIDLLVGLGLAALGLSTTSPQNVALPFKLLLFVAVDGWRLLVESLLKGYV
jgi:type III secretion protein R